jgi:hypothetical protein
MSIPDWIRSGEMLGARGSEPGQRFIVIIDPSNPNYGNIRLYDNPMSRIQEFRPAPGTGNIQPDRIIQLPPP